MKKSKQVPATLIVALAAGLASSGCSSDDTDARCVDSMGRMLPESACRSHADGARWIHVQTSGFGGSGSTGGASGSGSSGGFFGG
jgi:hypothetical protein